MSSSSNYDDIPSSNCLVDLSPSGLTYKSRQVLRAKLGSKALQSFLVSCTNSSNVSRTMLSATCSTPSPLLATRGVKPIKVDHSLTLSTSGHPMLPSPLARNMGQTRLIKSLSPWPCHDSSPFSTARPHRPASIITNPHCRRRSSDFVADTENSVASASAFHCHVRNTQSRSACQHSRYSGKVLKSFCKSAKRKMAHIRRTFSADGLSDSQGSPKVMKGRSLVPSSPASIGTDLVETISGTIVRVHPDGSRTIRLHKASDSHSFGLFLAKRANGLLFISRFNDPAFERKYTGLIDLDDEILEIEGHWTASLSLSEVISVVSFLRRTLVIRVIKSNIGSCETA